MWKLQALPVILLVCICAEQSCAFIFDQPSVRISDALSAVRQPRRNLKKRRGRERKSPVDQSPGSSMSTGGADIWTTGESRPLITSRQKEAGEDFWIDPEDLEKEKQRQLAIANRKSMEGEMSKEKLMTEVTAPYKQNWIGFFSVVIVVLAFIVTNFPEALENPRISFPDLVAGDPIPLQSTLKSATTEASEALQQ